MTSTRLEELPDIYAQPILELVAAARAASAPPTDPSAWAAAEAGQTKIRTGFKAPRRTASAGQCAAHAVRLAALGEAEPQPWTLALHEQFVVDAIDSWDWDQRMQAALDLRRLYKDLDKPVPASVEPVRRVANWLIHSGGSGLVPATARLAELVLSSPQIRESLRPAWYATHGRRLLAELAPGTAVRRAGAPTTEVVDRRDLLKIAVRGVDAASIMTKAQLAAAAGISRQALYPWLSTG